MGLKVYQESGNDRAKVIKNVPILISNIFLLGVPEKFLIICTVVIKT